jgi:hypothetical protein
MALSAIPRAAAIAVRVAPLEASLGWPATSCKPSAPMRPFCSRVRDRRHRMLATESGPPQASGMMSSFQCCARPMLVRPRLHQLPKMTTTSSVNVNRRMMKHTATTSRNRSPKARTSAATQIGAKRVSSRRVRGQEFLADVKIGLISWAVLVPPVFAGKPISLHAVSRGVDSPDRAGSGEARSWSTDRKPAAPMLPLRGGSMGPPLRSSRTKYAR